MSLLVQYNLPHDTNKMRLKVNVNSCSNLQSFLLRWHTISWTASLAYIYLPFHTSRMRHKVNVISCSNLQSFFLRWDTISWTASLAFTYPCIRTRCDTKSMSSLVVIYKGFCSDETQCREQHLLHIFTYPSIRARCDTKSMSSLHMNKMLYKVNFVSRRNAKAILVAMIISNV